MPKLLTHEKTESGHKYVVSLDKGRTAEVVCRMKRSGLQVDGGVVTGCHPNEEVSAFREAADWLTRFLEQDGAPRPDLLASL